MSKLRIWFEESLKFAACIGVFRLFEWALPTLDALWADVLKQIAVALAAGAITYGVTELLFGRPTIHLQWFERPEIPESGRLNLVIAPGGRQILQVQFHLFGSTWLSRWICARSESRPMELVITFRPSSLVALSRQNASATVDVHPHEIIFHASNGLAVGINDSVEFAMRKQINGAMMASPLDFSVKLRPASPSKIPFGRLVTIDNGIDGFQVRSS